MTTRTISKQTAALNTVDHGIDCLAVKPGISVVEALEAASCLLASAVPQLDLAVDHLNEKEMADSIAGTSMIVKSAKALLDASWQEILDSEKLRPGTEQ